MRALSSRPFCPCGGRRVSLRYLSAVGRYTAHVSLLALMYTAPTKWRSSQQESVASRARGARSVIPAFTDLCTDVSLHHYAGEGAGTGVERRWEPCSSV